MSTQPKTPGGGSEAAVPLAIVAFVVIVVGGAYGATHLAAIATDTARPPANPIDLAFGLINGEVTWSTTATIVAVAIALGVLLLLVLVLRLRGRGKRGRLGETRLDHMARYLGRGPGIELATQRHALRKAKELGAPEGYAGLAVGVNIADRQKLAVNIESTALEIAGMRSGKTTSRVVPDIVEAPGAVISTSNKRDVVDATRGVRSEKGQVWVLDPQAIVGEAPTWWWNPLSFVTTWANAESLADTLITNARADNTISDAFFDPAGKGLLAAFLQAAAVADRPITDVYVWCGDPNDDTAARILGDASPAGEGLSKIDQAREISQHRDSADDQRSGVYMTAALGVRTLTNPALQPWITRQGETDERPQFDPAAFVRSHDTLYLLSKEGAGSTGSMVTALTIATTQAAQEYGQTQPRGRIPIPLVCVLDEAANVCRYPNLPADYSHFGSRGILMRTILQDPSQGIRVWGREGMGSLWSNASVKSYLGGVDDADWLRNMSELIGDYDKPQTSVTNTRGGRSVTHSFQRARILEVARLRALPRGRGVVLASGCEPMLVRTVPWMRGPHAKAIEASIRAHDPIAERTLQEQYDELAATEREDPLTQEPKRRWWQRRDRR